jgi:hypothetical protein
MGSGNSHLGSGTSMGRGNYAVEDFVWRRLLAGLALASLLALGWGAASRFSSYAVPSRASSLHCGRAEPNCAAGGQPSGALYVARPGDTLWAIAVHYSHGRDPRPLEYTLEAQLGGEPLQPGDVLRIP